MGEIFLNIACLDFRLQQLLGEYNDNSAERKLTKVAVPTLTEIR